MYLLGVIKMTVYSIQTGNNALDYIFNIIVIVFADNTGFNTS